MGLQKITVPRIFLINFITLILNYFVSLEIILLLWYNKNVQLNNRKLTLSL